ncbi:MAG: hypothetical protein LBB19_01710 [Puniceicoccales bacterium]|jgi:hypothetical protein|nr:hypothetical protein [Puniceicoccales bacterium]
MMRKKLIPLGALALTHSIIWNVLHLRADVFEDLNRTHQAYQANPNDPQVAASYIRLFDTWTNDMGNIYAAHGGGGMFGFEGSCEGGLADRVLTRRGNVRCYPFLLGCWLNNKLSQTKWHMDIGGP